jgi:hypothetical protein
MKDDKGLIFIPFFAIGFVLLLHVVADIFGTTVPVLFGDLAGFLAPIVLTLAAIMVGFVVAMWIGAVIGRIITQFPEINIDMDDFYRGFDLLYGAHEKRKNDDLYDDDKPKNDDIFITEDGEFSEDVL